jgi:hypothetical protein
MAKTHRKLSKFNIFMKSEIKRVKKMQPNVSHKQAFKMAAQNWKSHSGKNHASPAHMSKKRHRKKRN